jgi:tetratricopeptide (TPR) repeat protein
LAVESQLPRRYALFRFIVGAVVALAVVAFATLQLASDALDARAAAAGTLPQEIPLSFGRTVYRVLDRVAPASYVERSLAQEALARGDAGAAERYAVRLPASPARDELFANIASMRGQALLAREYFLAAPDPDAVGRSADALAVRDPAAGYELEQLLEKRLALGGTHPDAVADAYWRMGRFANRQAWRQISGSIRQRAWLARGLQDFEAAVSLAPLSERYLVSDANQADLLGERERARMLFAQAAGIDPADADAVAGLGVIAWEQGDRSAAVAYLAHARALDPHALMVRALERDLR